MDFDVPNSVVVRRLTKRYGPVTALDNVSFRIGKGEIVGLLGPNGAGKSTTMKILAGLTLATSGSAEICGISVASRPEETRRRIGFMPENNPLPEDLRVREYLKFRAQIKGVPASEAGRRVDEAMEICELKRKAARRIIGGLSKGFRQRVGIADAVLSRPDVVIMDEPTIGLDPHQILAIRRLINGLRGKMSVVISSHILPEIELVCDRVIIINQGAIVASGSSESLRKDFAPYSKYKVSLKADGETFRRLLRQILGDKTIKIESSRAEGNGYFTHVLRAGLGSDLGAVLVSELARIPGADAKEVSEQKPSLEEIFMAATRRSWEEARSRKKADEEGGEF